VRARRGVSGAGPVAGGGSTAGRGVAARGIRAVASGCRRVRLAAAPRARDRPGRGVAGGSAAVALARMLGPIVAHRVHPFRQCNGAETSMGTTEVVPIEKDVRRRPTLPRSPPRSTIGAERLSFRVRDGTGRFPFAMVAETLWRCGRTDDRTSGTAQWTRSICGQVLGLLVPVSFTGYPASTSGLSTRWSTGGLTP
jgi:hypothetical protein